MQHPVLYSFRRCPYCLRAYLALKYAGLKIELREVELSDLPEEVLRLSTGATVPVLVFPDGNYIDESWDIVKWALRQNDPDNWLGDNDAWLAETEMLIELNDYSFKEDLDHYKYADRYPQNSQLQYRESCEEFIEELEEMLTGHRYLLSDKLSLADISIFPFIRQFSLVDKEWFDASPYPHVRHWLDGLVNSDLFQQVFQKHDTWRAGNPAIYL